jgi:signal transduction histidine kinase
MPKKHDPLASILGRLDDLDSSSLSNLVSRLARERRLLHTVFNILREGVLVIDPYGMIEYANDAAVNLLGLQVKDLGSMSLWKAVPDLARNLQLTHGRQLRESLHLTRELELSYPERRLVRLYIVPFAEDLAGAPIARYAVILSDITQDRSRTRQEIEDERVRSILDLAAGVAHELGNPLNSLTIHLQVLRRHLTRAAQATEAPGAAPGGNRRWLRSLDICTAEVARLDGIIRHFLDAVRPRPPDFAELDILRPLEESLEFLGPELESSGVRVDVAVESTMPVILGDRDQLKQAFYNIIKNAHEAMQAGGVIKVRTLHDDDCVYVQIGDTGAGIAEGDLGKVFQPYYTTRKGGSGLGLMIVERIVRAHGGSVGIDSRPGRGTVVTLQLPQKDRRIRLLED